MLFFSFFSKHKLYPLTKISTGLPIGANLLTKISTPFVIPSSKILHFKFFSPTTSFTKTVSKTLASFKVLIVKHSLNFTIFFKYYI